VRPELLAESRKHKAAKLLRQIPCIGPIRAARLIARMQTPHRFRSKRQLWTYSGLGIETHDSAQYRYVGGQVQRSKKPQHIRGLNRNHNPEMKEIFKSTYPTQSGKGVSQGLAGVRKAARENKEMKFTALLHHLTVDLLRTKSTSGPLNCQSETDGPPVDEAWDGSPGAAGDETIRRVR